MNRSLPFRPNVCMIVVNQVGKIFMGERAGEGGRWQFPQGGVEDGLSLEENVLKELSEELGAPQDKFQIIQRLEHIHEYDFRSPPEYAKDKWRGQSQTFWLVRFIGVDSDIQLDRYQPEFMSFKWVDIDDIPHIAEPIRITGYQGALDEVKKFRDSDK